MVGLSLLVLRAKDPDALVNFYTAIGVSFVREQHGRGPVHHAADLGGTTLEIYPSAGDADTTVGTRLGLRVASIGETISALGAQADVVSSLKDSAFGPRAVLKDPAGHKVELSEFAT